MSGIIKNDSDPVVCEVVEIDSFKEAQLLLNQAKAYYKIGNISNSILALESISHPKFQPLISEIIKQITIEIGQKSLLGEPTLINLSCVCVQYLNELFKLSVETSRESRSEINFS